MLNSIETGCYFAELIIGIGKEEQSLEIVRQVLGEKSSFEAFNAFNSLKNPEEEDYLTATDIFKFLKYIYKLLQLYRLYNSSITPTNCCILIKTYSRQAIDKLEYPDFLKMVLPRENPELRFKIIQRSNDFSNKQLNQLNIDVQNALAKLLNKEIEAELAIEKLREKLISRYDFNPIEVFKSIDSKNKTRYIDGNSLKSLRMSSSYISEDLKLKMDDNIIKDFIRRIDKDNDDKLNYHEFLAGVMPIYPNTNTKIGYAIPTKNFLNKMHGAINYNIKELLQVPLKEVKKIKKPLIEIDKKPVIPKKSSSVYEIIKEHINLEMMLNSMKQGLAMRSDISLKGIYNFFDDTKKGYIGITEVISILDSIDRREQAYNLFRRFDRDRDGKLIFSDIKDIFSPLGKELCIEPETAEEMTGESKELIKQIIKAYKEVDNESKNLNKELKEKYDWKALFKIFDFQGKGYCSQEDVNKHIIF